MNWTTAMFAYGEGFTFGAAMEAKQPKYRTFKSRRDDMRWRLSEAKGVEYYNLAKRRWDESAYASVEAIKLHVADLVETTPSLSGASSKVEAEGK